MQVGDTVGPYRIVSRLSEGGMATLLLGRREDAPGSELVAIKVIHEHLSQDWQFVRMFVDEALISVRLRHPNVVRVDELGEHGHLYYLVMEYVRGCSLAQLLRTMGRQGRRMRPEIAVWIAREVAAGLHAAHEMIGHDGALLGVVHRDVSPQNILLSADGQVKLLDFGIAKARGRADRTEAGVIKGKVRYMAPEQAGGEDIDRRVDVYALGVVLWEMLTMRRYIEGKSEVELIRKVRAPEPVAPSVHVPGIDARIDHAVLRALEPLQDLRPSTAHTWMELLDASIAVPIGPAHVAEVLRLFMAEEITENSRILPPEIGRQLAEAMQGAKPLPGEPPSAPVDDAARVKTLTSQVPRNSFGELQARSELVSEPSPQPALQPALQAGPRVHDGDAGPTVREAPTAELAAVMKRLHATEAQTSRGASSLPPERIETTRRTAAKPSTFAWLWKLALIVLAAFAIGAGLAVAWMRLR